MRRYFCLSLSVATLLGAAVPSLSAADLLPFGARWSYLNPMTAADNPETKDANFKDNWYKPSFSLNGPNKFQGPSAEPFARGTTNPDVSNIDAFTPGHANFIRNAGTIIDLPASRDRLTSYFRTEFTTTATMKDLALEFLADDGVRFYLDGNEILSQTCCLTAVTGGTPVPPGTTAGFTDVATGLGSERAYSLKPILIGQSLAPGKHTLAASVHQQSGTSNDMGFSARVIDGYVYSQFVPLADSYKYKLGDAEPTDGTLDWAKDTFDDSSWASGQEGFGYETAVGTNLGALIRTDVPEMVGAIRSLYLRNDFTVDTPSKYATMDFTIDYDDAFVAYINGKEVVRRGVTGVAVDTPVPFDATGATIASHDSTDGNGNPGELISINLANFPGLVKSGRNVLAIHGLNTTLDSSDFLMGQISLSGAGVPPNSGKVGDFNGDGALGADDIDQLSSAVRGGTNPAKFDLNGDRLVDDADRTMWIEQIKNTYIGDSNLDGEFSTSDFVSVFGAGEFEDAVSGNSTWGTGDWNGDGDFGTGDFVAAFGAGGFEQGPRPGGPKSAVAGVPEPTSAALALLGLVGLGAVRRRR